MAVVPLISEWIRRFQGLLVRRPQLRAHFWQSASNYLQMGGGIVISVLLARLLTPADFGHFAYAGSLVALALLPFNWTLTPSIVADGGRDEVLYTRAWALGWWLMAFRVGAVGLCAYGLWWAGHSLEAGLALLMGLPMAVSEPIVIFRADFESAGQYKKNFWSALWTVVGGAVLTVALALLGCGAWALALPGPLMWLGQLAIYARGRRRPAVWSWRGTGLRQALAEGFWIWLLGLGETALLRLDKVVLGRWSGPVELGHYNRAFSFAPLSHQLLNSFMTNPAISAMARARDASDKRRIFFRAAALVLAGALVSGAGWWFFADPLVPWIFGPQWREAIPAFQAFAGLSLAYAVSYLPVTILLQARSYRWIAGVRLGSLLLLAIMLWGTRDDLDAVRVAWLLQSMLVLQGIFFAFAAYRHLYPSRESRAL